MSYLTVREARLALGFEHPDLLVLMCWSGEVAYVRDNGTILIPIGEVERLRGSDVVAAALNREQEIAGELQGVRLANMAKSPRRRRRTKKRAA